MSTVPFTQAFNFSSATQGGVDPRTGLFMPNFPLGTVFGNNTLGPALALALRYSPLLIGNPFQLGNGMSLGLTTYDRTNRMLVLGSGERFKTDDVGGTAAPTIRQQKLDTVRLATSGNKIILTFRSGERQTLSEQGGNIYVPERIESPLGYMLNLAWKPGADSRQLTAITDAQGSTVCSLTYGADVVNIVLWPNTGEISSFNLSLSKGYLTKITSTSVSANLGWTLGYEADPLIQIDGQAPLKQIVSPTMLEESVQYKAGVMKFDTGTGLGALPAVIRYQQNPKFGQPIQTTTYEYSSQSDVSPRNYFGYGAALPESHHPDDDNLYNLLAPYDYWAIETREGDQTRGVAARSIERHYNKYHLLISETEREVGSPQTIKWEAQYYADTGDSFKNQPTIFQLPQTQTVTWNDGAGKPRTETTNFEYEPFGNLERHAAHDGTVTVYEYYPANNATPDCPAEPNGFTQLIRSRTVVPYVDYIHQNAPSLKTEWKYQRLDVRKGSTLSWAVLPLQVTHSADGAKLSTETFAYLVNVDGDEHGHIRAQTTTVHSHGADYPSTQTFTFTPAQTKLEHGITRSLARQLTTTVEAEPGNKKNTQKLSVSTSLTLSALTGRLLVETNALGNQTTYAYDALGRLTSRTAHPDTPAYSAKEAWTYTPASADGTMPTQVEYKDIFGNLSRISGDGLARVIREESKDSDGTLGWQTVQAYGYDLFGRNAWSATTEVLRPQDQAGVTRLSYTLRRKWDAWGTLREQTGQENRLAEYQIIDPIALTATSWTEGHDKLATAKRIVILDPRNRLPIKELQLAYDAETHAWDSEKSPDCLSRQQVWDGANQLRKVIDENNHVTQYDYDVYGRITATTLPDGTIIHRQYAPFSSAPLVVLISLQAKGKKESEAVVLGAQKFDGFGRLVEMTNGDRISSFKYASDAAQQPSEVTQPDGANTRYTTDVRLYEAPTEIITTRTGSPTISQSFTYNFRTGQMQRATEKGSGENKWTNLPSGRLETEGQNILSGGECQASYEYSLGGALQQSTSIDGNVQKLEYSTAATTIGQMVKLSESGLSAELKTYDGLQQLVEWTATDGNGNTLKTAREFDSFGRESLRTFTHNARDTRTVEQKWYPNSQLKQRTQTHKGETICTEAFVYDERDRLVGYTASGEQLPLDPYGNAFTAQTFVFDPLDNIVECKTTLKNGEINTAQRHHEYKDPCQLSMITNSLTAYGYPAKIHLRYDDAGRLTRDDAGRALTYDASGRLASIEGNEGKSEYGYDAMDRMVWQRVEQDSTIHRMYYQGDSLANEWIGKSGQKQDMSEDRIVQPIYVASCNVAQRQSDAGKPSTMLACVDAQNRILSATIGDQIQEYSYTPYGYCTPIPSGKKS
ncbi:RHS repeat protein [Burkholderia ambifaria]|uniref:YD repeat protein n=1 Tax=Burkholderia ambifaria MEX-5 TaxID=396597 RepID=B1T967_9BURK|nr:RHS repeat protein [Burkholderia ambifaria]EDT39884.1 YD repeat protein [Burkholderia ambifaria MEX-5]